MLNNLFKYHISNDYEDVFMWACANGQLELAQITYGKIKLCEDNYKTAFEKSCMNGHLDIVNWLYSLNYDICDLLFYAKTFIKCCSKPDLITSKHLYSLIPNITKYLKHDNCCFTLGVFYTHDLEMIKWFYSIMHETINDTDVFENYEDRYITNDSICNIMCRSENVELIEWGLQLSDIKNIYSCIIDAKNVNLIKNMFEKHPDDELTISHISKACKVGSTEIIELLITKYKQTKDIDIFELFFEMCYFYFDEKICEWFISYYNVDVYKHADRIFTCLYYEHNSYCITWFIRTYYNILDNISYETLMTIYYSLCNRGDLEVLKIIYETKIKNIDIACDFENSICEYIAHDVGHVDLKLYGYHYYAFLKSCSMQNYDNDRSQDDNNAIYEW